MWIQKIPDAEIILTSGDSVYSDLLFKTGSVRDLFLTTYSPPTFLVDYLLKNPDVQATVYSNAPTHNAILGNSDETFENLAALGAKVYIHRSNHSKVAILDDTVAYLGSANVTHGSRKNIECGVITRDRHTVKALKNQLVNELIGNAILYSGPSSRILATQAVVKEVREHLAKVVGGDFDTITYFASRLDDYLLLEGVEKLSWLMRATGLVQDIEWLLEENPDISQLARKPISSKQLTALLSLLQSDEIKAIANFNLEKAADRIWENTYSSEYIDDHLDAGLERAYNDAQETWSKLIQQKSHPIRMIASILLQLYEGIGA